MLTEQPILITSIVCAETDGIIKNRFIKFTGEYGAENVKSLGITNAEATKGEMVPVSVKGIALVQSGAAITLGAPLQTFDDGLAIEQDAGPLEGYAMDAASGADQLIRILLS